MPDRAMRDHIENMRRALRIILRQPNLPAVFLSPYPKILQLGAHETLLALFPEADRDALRRWFQVWCSHPAYRARLKTGTHRHDLDGCDHTLIADDAQVRAASGAAWLSISEVAARSGRSRLVIQSAARRGELPAELVTGQFRFRAADVERWLAATETGRAAWL